MKRENTVLRSLKNKVIIAGIVIEEIFFDLKHTQYGWDQGKRDYKVGAARNNYTEEDVISFFEQLNNLIQIPREQKAQKKSVAHRFIFYVYENDKKLKMVVDIMKNDAAVVVTIH